jgi:ATP-dependent exoDNAse (exonuclease V) beta subunit
MPAAAKRPQHARRRLSYSSLQDYARCPYRFYLSRVLGMPGVAPPPPGADAQEQSGTPAPLEGRIRGTLVHELLERLDFARPVTPGPEAVQAQAARAGITLDAAQVEDLQALVAAFARSPLCARLAVARGVRREAAFAFALERDGGGPLVSGFVDVVAREPDGTVLVVDYKTDRLGEEAPTALVERDYATQRTVYALAALEDGAARVEVAYVLLERPDEPVHARYDAADAPQLADELARLAEGVLSERWPVAAAPHRELCGDCPGRRTLCSWPESMTLRPPAAALAGVA